MSRNKFSTNEYDSRPFGVFDSGLGGLSVLKKLIETFPNESFVYIGDTARLPYGNKSTSTIRKYTEQIMEALVQQNVKALIVACNSASTTINESFWKNLPLYNVIDPGAELAVSTSQNKRIGLLGTRATILSRAYELKIKSLDPEIQIFPQACPLFVPLVEEGWTDDPITNLVTYRYTQPLLQNEIDTVILGCTHYPFLHLSLKKTFGQSIELVDSGSAVAGKILYDFSKNILFKNDSNHQPSIKIALTDYTLHSKNLCNHLMMPYSKHEIYSFQL